MVQHWPKSILFQCLAELSNTDPHLFIEHKKTNDIMSKSFQMYIKPSPQNHQPNFYLSRKPRLAFTFFVFPSSRINVRTPKTSCLYKNLKSRRFQLIEKLGTWQRYVAYHNKLFGKGNVQMITTYYQLKILFSHNKSR